MQKASVIRFGDKTVDLGPVLNKIEDRYEKQPKELIAAAKRFERSRKNKSLPRLGQWKGNVLTWHVIDVQDDRALLLLAEDMLGLRRYNMRQMSIVTWKACSLRRWLNEDFYEQAFIDEEKERILKVTVTPDGNKGNDTQDMIFLLSKNEATSLLTKKQLIFKEPGKTNASPWWLRTPDNFLEYSCCVVCTGCSFLDYSYKETILSYKAHHASAVRPALWIHL